MRVLFVASGNSKEFEVAPFIRSQADSLLKQGVVVDFFLIKGKGLRGYLSNIQSLRQAIVKNHYDVVHAHYSLTGWVALMALGLGKPLVVSFMGCDVYGDYNARGKLKPYSLFNIISAKILQLFVRKIIVKSDSLKNYVFMKRKVSVIPNGIDLDVFRPGEKEQSRKMIGLSSQEKIILFLGDTLNERKNFTLVNNVCEKYFSGKVRLLTPYPVAQQKIVHFLNACDVLVLSSFNEGSPNVIKEAMACNTPIVSTPVGDVEWLFKGTKGCFISDYDIDDFAGKIDMALDFASDNNETNGRARILDLSLDEKSIAEKIILIYHQVIK